MEQNATPFDLHILCGIIRKKGAALSTTRVHVQAQPDAQPVAHLGMEWKENYTIWKKWYSKINNYKL